MGSMIHDRIFPEQTAKDRGDERNAVKYVVEQIRVS